MKHAALVIIALLVAAPAGAQDFRVLQDTAPRDPNANRLPATLPPGTAQPRVLLAGDSWAQYMWDDGTHNKLFDRYGHADKLAVSRSLGSDPGPGYAGPEYAISGSEARQWSNTASYPWIANMTAALQAAPTIDAVMLSIGGNDVLAGKSGGGWYKDMDLDAPGSEAALFAAIQSNTFAIVDAALAVRPGLEVLIGSYDYPNFNTGLLCFAYACPKRRDLSRDPTNDLINDAELNGMMVTVESQRIDWAAAADRVVYDNSVGLMHYVYGDGVSAAFTLPRPGLLPPEYLPFPGGNPARPSLRSNFRNSADPIHLNVAGYEQKVAQETEGYFFPRFRGNATETFFSQGGANDGWTDGTAIGTTGIIVGDTGPGRYYGIVSFDTSGLPDGAVITAARFYLSRQSLTGTNPFSTGSLGYPRVDVASGGFGSPAVEPGDAAAPATAGDAGYAAGSVGSNGWALGVEIGSAALSALNRTGLTQFRLSFPATGGGAGADAVTFQDGDAGASSGFGTLASYMGTARPFLDVTYTLPVGVEDGGLADLRPRMLANSPNPFVRSTSIRFLLASPGPVRLDIVDVRGRRVVTLQDGVLAEGSHALTWDGRDETGSRVAAGVYFGALQAGGERLVRKLVLAD